MTTQQVSLDPVEMTRKTAAQIQAEILQRLSLVTQTHAAHCMGTSPSTVSRMVADDLEKMALLLASIGLRVCDSDAVVTSQDELSLYKLGLFRYLQADLEKERLATVTGRRAA